jgi:hypothetical protein
MFASRLVSLFVAVSLVCLALPAAGSAGSAKPRSTHAKSKHPTKKHKKTPKKKKAKKADESSGPLHGVVPAWLTAAFGVLKAPPVGELPTVITRSLGTSPAHQDLGVDESQARGLGGSSTPFYLIPAKAGFCLVTSDGGSACVDATGLTAAGRAQLAAKGLSIDLVGPATNADGSINPVGGPATSYGVVPDGFTQVIATTASGHTAAAAITDNGYVLTADAGPIVSRTYSGPTVAPVTLP